MFFLCIRCQEIQLVLQSELFLNLFLYLYNIQIWHMPTSCISEWVFHTRQVPNLSPLESFELKYWSYLDRIKTDISTAKIKNTTKDTDCGPFWLYAKLFRNKEVGNKYYEFVCRLGACSNLSTSITQPYLRRHVKGNTIQFII